MNRHDEHPGLMVLADVDDWRGWLIENEDASDGVWLALAKKGASPPTSLTYQEALEEALCGGWIDGQRQALDERMFRQRFTPRRARSLWSRRNVEIVERLAAQGRMRPRGLAEVERAVADGRWDRAYAGQATAELPPALRAALAAAPDAADAFAALPRAERYSLLHPLLTARDEAVLARRVERLVTRLRTRGAT